MKVRYTTDGIFGTTPCPFKTDETPKVNSHSCHKCRHYSSTNHKEKYVSCLFDSATRLREILNKIDYVIANDKFDDIVFEDFLSDIREKIAEILDE